MSLLNRRFDVCKGIDSMTYNISSIAKRMKSYLLCPYCNVSQLRPVIWFCNGHMECLIYINSNMLSRQRSDLGLTLLLTNEMDMEAVYGLNETQAIISAREYVKKQ